MSVGRLVLALAGLLLVAAPAAAEPCTAPLPAQAGAVFSGVVRYVGDGDSLCVRGGSDPRTWIEVRLADFDAPELHGPGGAPAKQRLREAALGREVRCVAERGRSGRVQVYDRVIARCRLSGQSLGDVLRARGGEEGGR